MLHPQRTRSCGGDLRPRPAGAGGFRRPLGRRGVGLSRQPQVAGRGRPRRHGRSAGHGQCGHRSERDGAGQRCGRLADSGPGHRELHGRSHPCPRRPLHPGRADAERCEGHGDDDRAAVFRAVPHRQDGVWHHPHRHGGAGATRQLSDRLAARRLPRRAGQRLAERVDRLVGQPLGHGLQRPRQRQCGPVPVYERLADADVAAGGDLLRRTDHQSLHRHGAQRLGGCAFRRRGDAGGRRRGQAGERGGPDYPSGPDRPVRPRPLRRAGSHRVRLGRRGLRRRLRSGERGADRGRWRAAGAAQPRRQRAGTGRPHRLSGHRPAGVELALDRHRRRRIGDRAHGAGEALP